MVLAAFQFEELQHQTTPTCQNAHMLGLDKQQPCPSKIRGVVSRGGAGRRPFGEVVTDGTVWGQA